MHCRVVPTVLLIAASASLLVGPAACGGDREAPATTPSSTRPAPASPPRPSAPPSVAPPKLAGAPALPLEARQRSAAGLSVGAWMRALDGLARHDLGAALKIYADDTTWHAMDATKVTTEGRAALRAVWGGLKVGFPDLRARPTRFVLLDDGLILLESVGFGTQNGDLGEHAATGRDFAVRQAQLSRVIGSVITESWVYSDAASLLSQLGFVHSESPMASVDPAEPIAVVSGPPNAANERTARRLYARLAGDKAPADGPATPLDAVTVTDHALGTRGTGDAGPLRALAPGTRPTIAQIHSAAHLVVVAVRYTGAKDTKGEPLSLPALHVLTFGDDGRLRRVDLYYDTIAAKLAQGQWPPADPTLP